MTAKVKKKINRRLHELIVKFALGNATAHEEQMIDRYQVLLRTHDPRELRAAEESHYRVRVLMKQLGGLMRQSAQSA